MATIIDVVFEENRDVLDYLDGQKETSRRTTLAGKLTKVLAISAASYFEFQITSAIASFAVSAAKGNAVVVALIKQKAIERQYHTYFDWDKSNANKFFSLFGEEFKARIVAKIKADETLSKQVASFLELGSMRNQLAHINFATFPLEKTSEEVYVLYKSAQTFVDFFEAELTRSA